MDAWSLSFTTRLEALTPLALIARSIARATAAKFMGELVQSSGEGGVDGDVDVGCFFVVLCSDNTACVFPVRVR